MLQTYIPNIIPCIQRYVANLCDRDVDNNQENVVYISSNNNNNFL